MHMKSNNSPQKVVARLFHKGDYFETLNNNTLKEFLPALDRHIAKCQHTKCILYRESGKTLS